MYNVKYIWFGHMRVSKAAIKHLCMSAISGVEYFKTHVAVSISRKKDVTIHIAIKKIDTIS